MSTPLFRRFKLILLLLTLPVAYVLSFGPVHALYSTDRLQSPIPENLVTFYKPVNWLYDNTPLGKPMTGYDDWWKGALKRS